MTENKNRSCKTVIGCDAANCEYNEHGTVCNADHIKVDAPLTPPARPAAPPSSRKAQNSDIREAFIPGRAAAPAVHMSG